jgi:hypothetical protein
VTQKEVQEIIELVTGAMDRSYFNGVMTGALITLSGVLFVNCLLRVLL